MSREMNRREALAVGMASFAVLSATEEAPAEVKSKRDVSISLVRAHADRLGQTLNTQVTDAQSRWCGGIPDQWGIHYCVAAAAFLRDGAAGYFHPKSPLHGSKELLERMKLAADFLMRSQNAEGFIDLLSTNFNSPPDTGFVVHHVATAAKLAQMHHSKPVQALLKDFLLRAGEGLARGGIHTPNHRWVVCAALAQIHELFPDKRYVERVDQWLAEGIDIDEEGQFTERSTAGYNAVVDTALAVTAHKLKRPELLEPVRRNLDAMAYLLHPNGEVVTEISRRQDLNTRGTMEGYWFVLRYMALHDGNGLYASMLKPLEPERVDLARLMEYPELQKELPEATPIPEDYAREYALADITRIRRRKTSVTLLHKGSSRWIALRRGEAVINAVRFASAFFGKGQFIPARYEKREDGYHFHQELQGRYLQPLTDPSAFPVLPDTWPGLVAKREMTQICRMVYDAHVRETPQGFEIAICAEGTPNVPIAIEVNLREGGALSGVVPVPDASEAFLLKEGFAEYTMGTAVIRLGPGHHEHSWVQLRGAEAKLPGPSVYLTAYTPLQHTLVLEMR